MLTFRRPQPQAFCVGYTYADAELYVISTVKRTMHFHLVTIGLQSGGQAYYSSALERFSQGANCVGSCEKQSDTDHLSVLMSLLSR